MDLDAAKQDAGVVTGADLLDQVSPLPTNWILPGMRVPVHRVLADEVARFQGEGLAAVVAMDAYKSDNGAHRHRNPGNVGQNLWREP